MPKLLMAAFGAARDFPELMGTDADLIVGSTHGRDLSHDRVVHQGTRREMVEFLSDAHFDRFREGAALCLTFPVSDACYAPFERDEEPVLLPGPVEERDEPVVEQVEPVAQRGG